MGARQSAATDKALAYYRKHQGRKSIAECAAWAGINRTTLMRALKREGK